MIFVMKIKGVLLHVNLNLNKICIFVTTCKLYNYSTIAALKILINHIDFVRRLNVKQEYKLMTKK